MCKIALFIGRFQPFHFGHMVTVEKILNNFDNVIIGIGSSQYGFTAKNPFTYEERKDMIDASMRKTYFGCDEDGNERWSVYPVPDIHFPVFWIEHVIHCVPKFDVVYSGNANTIKLFKKEKFDVVEIVIPEDNINGTDVRIDMAGAYESKDDSWMPKIPVGTYGVCKRIEACKRIYYLLRSEMRGQVFVPKPYCNRIREKDGILQYVVENE